MNVDPFSVSLSPPSLSLSLDCLGREREGRLHYTPWSLSQSIGSGPLLLPHCGKEEGGEEVEEGEREGGSGIGEERGYTRLLLVNRIDVASRLITSDHFLPHLK